MAPVSHAEAPRVHDDFCVQEKPQVEEAAPMSVAGFSPGWRVARMQPRVTPKTDLLAHNVNRPPLYFFENPADILSQNSKGY